ncbi:hypothetical protein DC498_18860 [Terrimonas sp.]|uniref:tetratricopeptide repeat protein n=1 Tax=Terrimonas sp. TaxID=1914338 RepID=UPI000D517A06|nr:tetratricopeptide repeat protein [Terrimonas sp.]PVD50656.1 hypothetical protein DC498_18860 [Terrimonas sp.]
MRYAVCLFCFICAALACAGQAYIRDSLLRELNNHPKRDTVRLNVLIAMANACRYDSAELGIKLTDEAIQLAQKLNNMANLGHAYHLRGVCHYTKGEFQTDIEFQKKAFAVYMKVGDSVKAANALNRMGTAYTSLADYPQALNYLQQAEKLADEANIKRIKAAVICNTALVYYFLSDYTKSLDYNQQGLMLFRELGVTASVAVILNNIGDIYLKTGEYEKVIELNREALQLNKISVKSTKGDANYYLAIGTAFRHLQRYDSALAYLERSLTMYRSLNASNNVSLSLNEIASIYAFAPDSFFNIPKKERLNTALFYQREALALAKEAATLDNLSNQWKTLSEIYEKAGNPDLALLAYKSYFAIHDSIAGDKTRKEITRKEVQAEADKTAAVLKAQHIAEIKQQETTRKAYLIGAGLIIVSSLLVFFLYLRRRNTKTKQVEAELKAEIADTQMKALRSQMNPHFIYNSLNSIRYYNAQNNTKLTDEYLLRFSMLMRQVFENSDHKKVSLADDLNALELYMQIEAARLDHKFDYEINIDTEIDKENTMIPPLLLQPFVENSIWHGISPKNENGMIRVGISRQSEMIRCTVEDDGVGIKKNNIEECFEGRDKHRPSGFLITQTRINLMNKIQNSNASLRLFPLNNGTRIEITLPLELNF